MPRSKTKCPSCGKFLSVKDDTAYCADCDLRWAGVSTRGKRLTGYALSLPERFSRILVGSTAGLFKGVSDLLLPEAVRRTKLYQVLLQKNLRYLIQDVGGIQNVYPTEEAPPSRYVARKFVGNFVELAGILTLRASPVWILALIADISGGTKVFLKELTEEMKRQGQLDPQTRVETVDQLLDGLQSFAGQVADRIDTPPLSVEELRETLRFLRQEAQALKLRRAIGTEEIDSLLRKMEDVAQKENRSLFEISAALGLNAINQLERSGRTAVTGLRVGKALLDRTIFQYYARAVTDLSRAGYYRYLARASKPYLSAISRHLGWKNVTWTERYFLSRAWNTKQ